MKKWMIFLLVLVLCAPVGVSALEGKTEIYTPEDLLAIADNPSGSYVLMADIDMTGVSWPCPAFSGELDGNGYAILNLTVTQPADTTKTAYDGNYKPYESQFAGLFSYLENAEIKNLSLINMRALVTTDSPCFLGGIAGFCWNSTISGCTVQATLELRAHDGMFGVAGLVGYGSGTVEACDLDVTLICTDTDKDTKDEQFMGGILANGFMDIKKCNVKLDGYSSEYGYAHNGGLVGMYYQKPFDPKAEHHGRVVYNSIDGKITFFECNSDRRAYCKAVIGEPVADRYGEDYNKQNFQRDERREYDVELRPHSCESPVYTAETVDAGCDSFGYTRYTCACGYSYLDDYTLKAHSLGPWETVTQPTAQAPGQSRAVCTLCGAEVTREDAYIPPETTPAPTTPEPTTQPEATQPETTQPESKGKGTDWILLILLAAVIVAAAAVGYLAYQDRQRKRRRRRRRPNL